MEAKHRGSSQAFVRGNKMVKSLFRVTKPASKQVQSSSRVSPSPCTSNGSEADSPTRQSYYANPPSIHKVSTTKLRGVPDIGGDENVDMKAATYISYVRERFMLERAEFEAL
uniref:Uncharacterized protein n=1 Tax=Populus davidiana TaxID=266767 RepID=A0A6M2EMU1_9ROSI